MKLIIWKRSTSSTSSSSRNPLAGAVKDDISESGSDFFDDFCMISGRHSSTLERLYAWEKKLHDEVKVPLCIVHYAISVDKCDAAVIYQFSSLLYFNRRVNPSERSTIKNVTNLITSLQRDAVAM